MMRSLKCIYRLFYPARKTIVILSVMAVSGYFLFPDQKIECTSQKAYDNLQRMCFFHGTSASVGLLCIPMCHNNELFQSIKCHSDQRGSSAVFRTWWHDRPIVFKLASTNQEPLTPSGEKEFIAFIQSVVQLKLNLTLPYDDAVRLSHLKSPYDKMDYRRPIEKDNIRVLVQDMEYLLAALYADKDIFPQIVGTCGHYFAHEILFSLQDFPSVYAVSETLSDWGIRLKIALQLLDLLEEFETGFHEPIHLCDIQFDHFGHVKDGSKLKFLDLSDVFPKSIVDRIVSANRGCEKDEDCGLNDCRSRCDLATKKCVGVTNNNLQMVCEKIFLGWRRSSTVIIPGLLMTTHTPTELASLLRQCANPQGEDGPPRAAADDDIKKRLVNVISEIEQAVNRQREIDE